MKIFGVTKANVLRTCRGCGCDDNNACETGDGPCAWVLLDIDTPSGICSACADEFGWRPTLMINVGREEEPELLAAAGGSRR